VRGEWNIPALLISKFRLVLNVVRFLLGNSQASEFYMPTFRNTLFHLHRQVGMKNVELINFGVLLREKVWPHILHTYLPINTEQAECSETSAYKIQTPGNYPEENMKHFSFNLNSSNKGTFTRRIN
jgi:hypothetical protein